jgi:predicted MPP superfamily phosphohydrolase
VGKQANARRRWILRAALAVFASMAAVCAIIAWCDTMANPVVRTATITLPGLAPGTPPLRAVLMSDLHVARPDMPPERLARIVTQINALHPDIVFVAGDLVSDRHPKIWRYAFRDALAPLANLESRFGTIAVLGNHDQWRNPAEARFELRRLGIEVLDNIAIRRGPLLIGGLGDLFTHNVRMSMMLRSMGPDRGAAIVVSHSPDPFYRLPKDIPLMLAGHTHCGQIRYPWGGSPQTGSYFGQRYACGRVDENGHTLIVTAGLGTSLVPVRFLAKPDVWLVTLVPPKQ